MNDIQPSINPNLLNIPAELSMDLADPDSEISQFIDEFFLYYLTTHLSESNRSAKLDQWNQLQTEQQQTEFLNQIDPNFLSEFQAALTQELTKIISQNVSNNSTV